jgi:hypothetical protein
MHSMFYTKASIPSGHTNRAYHGAYHEVYSVWRTVGHTKMDCPWGLPREAYQEGIPRGAYQESIPWGTPRGLFNVVYCQAYEGGMAKVNTERHTKRAY